MASFGTQKKKLQKFLSRMWPAISGKLQGWNPPSLLSCVSKEEIHLRPLQSGSWLVSQQYLFSLREVFSFWYSRLSRFHKRFRPSGSVRPLLITVKSNTKVVFFLTLAWSHCVFFWKASSPWVNPQRAATAAVKVGASLNMFEPKHTNYENVYENSFWLC